MSLPRSRHALAGGTSLALLLLAATLAFLLHTAGSAGQNAPAKKPDPPVKVTFTDIRKQAGITFLQDSTQTDEKLYLETMGTGVGWLDYDQDGLMDLYFVQSGPTELYQPDHAMRSALYHNNRSEEHTSELQSLRHLVCRLLLEKKNKI